MHAGLALSDSLLAPLDLPPAHPLAMARFGLAGIRSANSLTRRFDGDLGPALLAGLAAHSVLDLGSAVTGGFGMLLGALGHIVGWPMAEGGSQAIADALVTLLARRRRRGALRRARSSRSTSCPPARAVLCDVTPATAHRHRRRPTVAGATAGPLRALPVRARRVQGRLGTRRSGAVDRPAACTAPAPCTWAGPLDEVRRSEHDVTHGRHPEAPFLLLAQQSLFDPHPCARRPAHAVGVLPRAPRLDVDMTERIESRIEAFAPGFRDRILARHAAGPAQIEPHNANYVGGDITGGIAGPAPVRLPTGRRRCTPGRRRSTGLYLCSSSTPPGGGVHGMCGRAAARAVLSDAGPRAPLSSPPGSSPVCSPSSKVTAPDFTVAR